MNPDFKFTHFEGWNWKKNQYKNIIKQHESIRVICKTHYSNHKTKTT